MSVTNVNANAAPGAQGGGAGAPAPGGGAGAGAVANAPPAVFALSPGLAAINTFLNYRLSDDVKLYRAGSKELAVTLTGKPSQLRLLKKMLSNRALEMGWNTSILSIPTNVNQTGPTLDVLSQHGQLSYAQLTAHAVATIVARQTRAAQDNLMMYMCLNSSMSENCSKRLLPESDKYTLSNVPIASMLFKVLVGKAEAQTIATTANIRKSLANIKEDIKRLRYDIQAFHEYVKNLVQDLNGYGQSDTPDLTIQLFDSYMIVPDKIFIEMIGKKHTDYLLGSSTIDPTDLMAFAQTAYNVRKSDITIPWLQKSEEQVQIEALTAELKVMKTQKDTKKPKKKKDVKKDKDTATPKNEKGKKGNGGDKWAWKLVAPDEGEPEKKMVDEKWYHWCPYHRMWTVHKPSECKLKDKKPAAKIESNSAEIDTVDSNEDPDEKGDDDDDAGTVLASYAAALGGVAGN